MTAVTGNANDRRFRHWLRIESSVLFLAIPALHVVYFDRLGPFMPLAAVFVTAAILLSLTRGFRWRSALDFRPVIRHLPMIAGFAVLCAAVTFGLAYLIVPERILSFPRNSPDRFLLVIALYPFLSVLGQEIAYRLLFFERYRGLFPNDAAGIVASAFVFAAAHAFFLNWIAISLSFAGGLVFAWAYVRTASFPVVWILHSLAGQILFASGLGVFFYHGAIPV